MASVALGAGLLAVLALAGLLIPALGPLPMLAGAAAVAVSAITLADLRWSLGALVLVNLLAVASAPLPGNLVLSEIFQPARPLVLAVFALHALRHALGAGIPIGRLIVPFVPLIGVMAVSVVLAPRPPSEASNIFAFAVLLLAAAVLAWPLSGREEDRNAAIRAAAFACGAVVILNLVLAPIQEQPAFISDLGTVRFQGIMENPNSVGLLGFASVPLLFAAGRLTPAGSASRMGWNLLTAVACVEVVASVSRAGLAGLAAAAVVLFLGLTARQAGRRFAAALFVGCVLLAIGLAGAASELSQSLRLSTLPAASGRANAAQRVLELAPERPFVGYGYGSSVDEFERLGPIPRFRGHYSGNLVIDLLLETGAVGILVFLLTVALALRGARRAWLSEKSVHLSLATWLAVVAGGLINAQAESFLLRPGGAAAPVFWLGLAMCSAIAIRARTSTGSPGGASPLIEAKRTDLPSGSRPLPLPGGARPSS